MHMIYVLLTDESLRGYTIYLTVIVASAYECLVYHYDVMLHCISAITQERYMSITNRYYRETDAVIIVYDCCDEETFHNIEKWYGEVHTYLTQELGDGMPVVLVANKKDKIPDTSSPTEVVDFKAAKELAANMGVLACMETSAKTGNGITEVFEKIAEELLHRKGPKSAGCVDKIQRKKGRSC